MALSRVKTWIAGEILTADDLNAEFNNILDNPVSLISPITASFDLDGNVLILDGDGDTTITADSDDRIDIRIGGTDSILLGHDSTNSSAYVLIDPPAITAQANTDFARLHIDNDAAVTVPTGTTAVAASVRIEEPNLTATGTITAAASLYIVAAPTEGTSNYALWVDAGATRLDGSLFTAKGGDIASASPLVIGTDGNYFDVTGTTNFAAMTVAAGMFFMLQFDGALTITHGSGITLPGAANITTVAGDKMICFATAADTVDVLHYQRGAAGPDHIGQGTHTLYIPAAAMSPTVSNGCASLTKVETTAGRPDLKVLDFDATADEHAQFEVAFPDSADLSQGVSYRVFWASTATDTDGVTFFLQGVACADGDTADAAYGTAVTVDDAAQSTNEDVYATPWSGTVTPAGSPGDDELTFFRLGRDVSDANDTMAEDARVLGVQLRYTVSARDDS